MYVELHLLNFKNLGKKEKRKSKVGTNKKRAKKGSDQSQPSKILKKAILFSKHKIK